MTVQQKHRSFHAALAITSVLAFATGELGGVHNWIGYAAAAVLAGRLLWAIVGPRQFGIARLFPAAGELAAVDGLRNPAVSRAILACIVVALAVSAVTGVMASRPGAAGWIGGLHEGASNAAITLAVVHAGYILIFKRPLGRYMLFWSGRE